MGKNANKPNGNTELGPEITGTLIVGGRRTANGRIYSPKVLAHVASNPRIQAQILTHSFIGNVVQAKVDQSLFPTAQTGDARESCGPKHLVKWLGVEDKELCAVTNLIPATFPDKRVMQFLPDALKAGSVVFNPIGMGSVDANGVVGFDYDLQRIDLVVLEKHDVKLPSRYVPNSMGIEENVTPRPIMYAIGHEYRPGEWGMTHGLVADVKDMLDTVPNEILEPPKSVRTCIIRYNSDGTDTVLYKWQDKAWVRICE